MIAWCTQHHGTRLIPAGAITGLQYLKTNDYIQIAGFINQTYINLNKDDYGGEMDPHGADLRGNPLGGVVFSDVFSGTPGVYRQVPDWTNFMGGNAFCFKACNPAGTNPRGYCQNVYDRIGCAYNVPNAAKQGVFESCDASDALLPGVYTSGAVTMTYTQPAESLGVITSMPYTADLPKSSNCVQLTSSVLFADLATITPAVPTESASSLTTSKKTSSTGSSSGSGSKPTAGGSTTNDGSILAISGISIFGVFFSALFLA